eukprot:703046-Rhodomonas_salina.1
MNSSISWHHTQAQYCTPHSTYHTPHHTPRQRALPPSAVPTHVNSSNARYLLIVPVHVIWAQDIAYRARNTLGGRNTCVKSAKMLFCSCNGHPRMRFRKRFSLFPGSTIPACQYRFPRIAKPLRQNCLRRRRIRVGA